MEAVEQKFGADSKESQVNWLGRNIRSLRKGRRLSQEDLARSVGLNRGNIASYENGSAEPKICNLLKISELFGVPMLDLTVKDLSCKKNLQLAYTMYQQLSVREQQSVDDYYERSKEIANFIEGLGKCFQFKTKDASELSSDALSLVNYFNELHEISEELLHQHTELLQIVRCQTQPTAKE